MIIYLIRHAESANNYLMRTPLDYTEYVARRQADPPLTALGEQQAQLVAEHLSTHSHPPQLQEGLVPKGEGGYGITQLYCSAMLRSIQTAAPIANALGLRPHIWIDIHEHGGLFCGNPHSEEGATSHPGLGRTEILSHFGACELPAEVTEGGWWNNGYEDDATCFLRAIDVAQTLYQRAEENQVRQQDGEQIETIAMVSHGTFMDYLIKALLKQPLHSPFHYGHYNTAITRLEFYPENRLTMRYINKTQHLASEFVSK